MGDRHQRARRLARRALTGRGLVALEQVGGYLRGTTVTAAADSLSDFVYLTLLGVPLAGPLAVIVFIGGFVPYLGGIVTASILALVTLATQGWVAAAAILALIGLTNILQARYLTPLVYGPVARIPIALAVFALPAGLALFGVAGLFITLPAIAVIYSFAPAIVESLGTIGHQASANPLVPLWLDRLGQWSWRLLVVFGLTWLLVTVAVAPFFSVPIVLAALMAPALSPFMAALRARGLSPTAAALAVTAATIAVIVVVMAITIYTVATQLPEIINQGAIGAEKLGIGATAAGFVRGFGGGLIETTTSLIASAAGVIFALVISILLVFFFLRDGETWWAALMTHVSTTRRSRVDQVGRQSAGILRGTMIGTAIVSFAGGVLQWFTMLILGLPLAFPIGVLMFLFGFVPVHRRPRRDLARVPRGGLGRQPGGRHPDVHLHDRVQHRPGQRRPAARVRQDGQHPPGGRADGDPGRWRDRRAPGDGDRRADHLDHLPLVADRPPPLRPGGVTAGCDDRGTRPGRSACRPASFHDSGRGGRGAVRHRSPATAAMNPGHLRGLRGRRTLPRRR